MDFHATMQKNASERGLLGPRPVQRPVPPPNAAHEELMQKAQALVERVAKSGTGGSLTIEQAFEKVFSDKANRALAQAALRPASMKGIDGNSPAGYEDDGGNTAHNPRNAVIGLLGSDKGKTGRPASATRTFGLGTRKAKIATRVRKFLTMCPGAGDDEALGYALSPKG